ncbi:MAG TPA: hypothetical protein VKE93_04710 [Candidatus Angelobacter sp.]|nr:hypothetical protein [Candidatus Angelobacter sp.]
MKIAVFLAVFGLLFVIARVLARAGETHVDSSLPPSSDIAPVVANDPLVQDPPPLTGAEFGMPIPLPAIQIMDNGSFNRPIVTNYYFGKIDLARGPADPACFYDEFFLELRHPSNPTRWTNRYIVATPAGLSQAMDQNKFDSIYLDAGTVIVPRWDLGMILQTVIDQMMQDNAPAEASENKPYVEGTT